MKDALLELGIRFPDLVAGFFGGVVNAFVFKRSAPVAIIGSIVVGTVTANYLGQPVGAFFGFSGGAASFVVGLAGMSICQGLLAAVKRWHPSLGNGGGDGCK